jgi:hypothetical protein
MEEKQDKKKAAPPPSPPRAAAAPQVQPPAAAVAPPPPPAPPKTVTRSRRADDSLGGGALGLTGTGEGGGGVGDGIGMGGAGGKVGGGMSAMSAARAQINAHLGDLKKCFKDPTKVTFKIDAQGRVALGYSTSVSAETKECVERVARSIEFASSATVVAIDVTP